jgi:signal transduction histidine kinase
MSYELRTPLTTIVGYTELLAEDADESLRRDLAQIESAARRLVRIVNSLVDVARLESGRVDIEIEPVSVADLVTELAASVRPLAEEHDNQLIVLAEPGLGSIETDGGKLRQVVQHLLTNAARFTRGGQISLHVTRDTARPGMWFSVSDTGVGIPHDRIARLFEPFAWIDDGNAARSDGTGLGLAISRRLAELLGGRIEIESQPGVGSTFRLWLPERAGDRPARASEMRGQVSESRL